MKRKQRWQQVGEIGNFRLNKWRFIRDRKQRFIWIAVHPDNAAWLVRMLNEYESLKASNP